MKLIKSRVLILVFGFTGLLSMGQNKQNIDSVLKLQTRSFDRNSYCVQTVFNKLNYAYPHLQQFLQRELKVVQSGSDRVEISNGVGTIEMVYTQPIIFGKQINHSAYHIHLKYHVFLFAGEYFVEKLNIWGNWESATKIFSDYYPTRHNVEYHKDNTQDLVKYFVNERIHFSAEQQKGVLIGKINVQSITGESRTAFIEKYKNKF